MISKTVFFGLALACASAMAVAAAGCGGSRFSKETAPDAGTELRDAGPEALPPIVCGHCDDPVAAADAGIDGGDGGGVSPGSGAAGGGVDGDDGDASADAGAGQDGESQDATVVTIGAAEGGVDRSVDDVSTDGAAEAGCAAGYTLCHDACVELSIDTRNCGACGNDCSDLPNVGATGTACVLGRCSYQCTAGYGDCAEAGTGCATSLRTTANCGSCTVGCSGAAPVCAATVGAYSCGTGCAAGEANCGGTCTDVASDPAHCGGCDAACAPPALGQATCSGGACGMACSGSLSLCGAACVDERTDSEHCGGCNAACGPGTRCSGGQCVCDATSGCSGCCSGGTTCEPYAAQSSMSCGSEGNECAPCAGTCGTSDGQCACPAGQTLCGATCVDEQTDSNNCGACGTTCPISCAQGTCLRATAISAGLGGTACALISNGTVRCWGNNQSGAVGNGTSYLSNPQSPEYVPTPTEVVGLTGATGISVGAAHACATVAGGGVACWGDNYDGELGNGTAGNNPLFLSANPVSGLSGAKVVAANGSPSGGGETCALLSSGGVDCWGEDCSGQIGNGTTSCALAQTTPAAATLVNAVAIAVGGLFACAVVSDGTVSCWGDNGLGEIGNGSTTGGSYPTPVPVPGITTAAGAAAGAFYACVLLSGGAVECWGYDLSGQLGNGSTTVFVPRPVAVSGLTTAAAVSAGPNHACALLLGGAVECWGDNFSGELGNGTTTSAASPQTTPVQVQNLTDATVVAAGSDYTCALTSTGNVECWGDNAYAELGIGTTSTTPQTTPVPVQW